MTTIAEPQISIPARQAALAWTNAFLAASTEESRTVLYRTLCLEFFPRGIQFIGCDGTALFRTWVPDADAVKEHERAWPLIEEAPDHAVVVMDVEGFGLAFMKALLKLTSDDVHAYEALAITIAPADEEATLALGEQFQAPRATLRACGQRIDLRTYEGEYVRWRSARLGIEESERVPGLTLASRMFQLVGKLKGATKVDLEFYGDHRHVAFTAHGETETRGLLMPMRRSEVEA